MKTLKAIYSLLAAGVIVQTFQSPDVERFLNPHLAGIIFYHLPCVLLASFYIAASLYFAIRYLTTQQWEYEVKSAAANEMAFVLALLALATGVLFSKAQWGRWWQWDPVQSSFLFVVLILFAYQVLRLQIGSPQRRAIVSAKYAAASSLPCLLLILVFPRLPYTQSHSFHPSNAIVHGWLNGFYLATTFEMLAVLLILTLWIFRAAVEAAWLEFRSAASYEVENL